LSEVIAEHTVQNAVIDVHLVSVCNRSPGRVSVVRSLREAFDAGGLRPSLTGVDVHSVASLLKSYLCALPQPIIPTMYYDRVMHIVTRERPLDADAAVSALSDAIHQLPCANYDLLRYLCEFLHSVAQCSEVNRMTSANLATVFSACVIKPEVDDPALLAGTAANRTTAVQDMIEHFSHIFDSRSVMNVTQDALNGTVTETSPDSHSVDETDLIDLRMSVSVSSDCNVSTNIDNEPVTDIDDELQLNVVMLRRQLDTERCTVRELRQQLVTERREAAQQVEQLARKLDEERTATANAVERVVELQTKLEQYSMKYGPLS